ncbi:hypothetical protein PATSB16_09260 [Pandoraea thiooxydans]|nr:hypothetical protein PATSB16_09260 [Pandoraea thiooxydans]
MASRLLAIFFARRLRRISISAAINHMLDSLALPRFAASRPTSSAG